MRYLLALSFLVSFLSPCLADDASDPGPVETQVRQAQASRFQAMLDVDAGVLGALLADDLTYTHSTGLLESKQKFLESLRAQTIRYLSISPQDMQVRIFYDSAVITGITDVRVHVGGEDRTASLRITEVHQSNDNGWQLVAYQSTHVAEQK